MREIRIMQHLTKCPPSADHPRWKFCSFVIETLLYATPINISSDSYTCVALPHSPLTLFWYYSDKNYVLYEIFAYTDDQALYMIMPYCQEDMLCKLMRCHHFSESQARQINNGPWYLVYILTMTCNIWIDLSHLPSTYVLLLMQAKRYFRWTHV